MRGINRGAFGPNLSNKIRRSRTGTFYQCAQCGASHQLARDAANCTHNQKQVCDECETRKYTMCPSCKDDGYTICRECCEYGPLPCEIWDSVEDEEEMDAESYGFCAVCDHIGMFRVEDLPVGPRWFCTEKHYAQYAGLPVEKPGYYGFEAEGEIEKNYYSRFGDQRGGKEWGRYYFTWFDGAGDWKPIDEDTKGWDEDDFEEFRKQKGYELVEGMLEDCFSGLYEAIENNQTIGDEEHYITDYQVRDEDGNVVDLDFYISWDEPYGVEHRIQYYEKEPLQQLEFYDAEDKKMNPLEKAEVSGVVSGATMEGLETLLAAEGEKVNDLLNEIIEDVFREFKVKTWLGWNNNWYDDILESQPKDGEDEVYIAHQSRWFPCYFGGKGKCFEIPNPAISDRFYSGSQGEWVGSHFSSIKYVSDNDYGMWTYRPTKETEDKIKAYQEKLRKKYGLPIELSIRETYHENEYSYEPSLIMGVSLGKSEKNAEEKETVFELGEGRNYRVSHDPEKDYVCAICDATPAYLLACKDYDPAPWEFSEHLFCSDHLVELMFDEDNVACDEDFEAESEPPEKDDPLESWMEEDYHSEESDPHPSLYWFVKDEIMKILEHGDMTESDLATIVEMVATKAPLYMIDRGMKKAEELGDRPVWEVLKMSAITRIELEKMDDEAVFSEKLGHWASEEVITDEGWIAVVKDSQSGQWYCWECGVEYGKGRKGKLLAEKCFKMDCKGDPILTPQDERYLQLHDFSTKFLREFSKDGEQPEVKGDYNTGEPRLHIQTGYHRGLYADGPIGNAYDGFHYELDEESLNLLNQFVDDYNLSHNTRITFDESYSEKGHRAGVDLFFTIHPQSFEAEEDDYVEMMECPHCSEFGDGEIPTGVDIDRGDRWSPPTADITGWEMCEYCEGKGEVEDTPENQSIPTWDWDYLIPDEPDYDRYEDRYDDWDAEGAVFESPAGYCPECGGRMVAECQECYHTMAESFEAESNGDRQLEESIKRTKMSAIRTGLAITTFGIVLWNLWTNKKQEKQISDIMGLV